MYSSIYICILKYRYNTLTKYTHSLVNLSYQPIRKRYKSHIRHIYKRLHIREGVVKRYLGE